MKGDAKDLVGNPCNYFSMNKYTKHPEACVEFLKMLYSDKCVEDQLKAGNLPATTNASEMVEKVVDNASDGAFLEWESQALTDAPHFMITWTPNMCPRRLSRCSTACSSISMAPSTWALHRRDEALPTE